MTASSPHASSWPPAQEEDDGLELLAAGPRAVHRVARAPMPSSAPVDVDGPSIVISPHAEVPTAAPRRKRPAEPTLVIRDKHQVDELRAGVRRIARAKARQRWKTLFTWGGASALAFGMGTAVAFFAARSGGERPDPADSPFAAPVLLKGDESGAAPGQAREAKLAVPVDSAQAAPEQPAPVQAVPAQAAVSKPSEPEVLSLSDLPEAPEKSPQPTPSSRRASAPSTGGKTNARSAGAVGEVVSLEDL